MTLSKYQIKSLRWGSHVPVTLAIIKTFPITGALELGAGTHSTKVLFDNLKYVTSIENDLSWINKLRKNLIEDETHQIVHQLLPENIRLDTPSEHIETSVLEEASEFYKQYLAYELDYLFVDCFSGFRLQALTTLYQNFNVITYHDANERYDKHYGYSKFFPSDDYVHFIDETFEAHTGLLISNYFRYLIPEFKENLAIEAKKFAELYDTTCRFDIKELDSTDH